MFKYLPLILLSTSLSAEVPYQFGDTVTLTQDSKYVYLLEYDNGSEMQSNNGTWSLEEPPCTYKVKVAGPETVTVECTDGWVATPNMKEISDGEKFTFIIMKLTS